MLVYAQTSTQKATTFGTYWNNGILATHFAKKEVRYISNTLRKLLPKQIKAKHWCLLKFSHQAFILLSCSI